MALGKTVTYTPFQETSFGYGSTELATNYSTEFPNGTDTVKIIIEHTSGNWDTTGHISTPSSGTAVSFYNKGTKTWTVTGERDDVDTVLSQLKFFPADNPESRPYDEGENSSGFRLLKFKDNQTSGNFANENPPAIGDTIFSIKAYDGSDVQQASETLTFDPTEPSYDNQRPYFSTEPTTDDYSSSAFDSNVGSLLDLGTISHGTDTENVTVTVYFRNYSTADVSYDSDGNLDTSSFITNDALGGFLNLSYLYINDKKPSELESDSLFKFEFTGSVKECQTLLDNIKYKTKSSSQEKTFQMVVTVDDGIVGSTVVKNLWHDQTIVVNTLPDQTFKEDATAKFDLGSVVFSNYEQLLEVNSYKAVITLDATGISGASSFGTTTAVDTQTYSSGVLTIVDNNLNTLKHAVRNLEFVPVQDFADDFTFTVQFTFENTTFGSSYTHTAQTVNVTAQEQAEVENITVTHNWNEDQVYYFKRNNPLQIIHPFNENFRVDFKIPVLTDYGVIDTTSSASYTKTILNDVVSFTGTRDVLNDVLENLYYAPDTDFDQSFTISVTVERTSGSNLTNVDVSTGTFTMSATTQEEYSHTQPAKITWNEDVDHVDFATGIEIQDTSLDDPLLPAYGGKFKMTLRAVYNDGTSVSTDDITWSCFNTTNVTVTGSGTVASPLVITGDRVDMNIAVNSLRMVPAADFTATQDFKFEYKLERGESTDDFYATYVDYSKSVEFDKGIPSDEFSTTDEYKFGIDRITALNSYEIVDVAKNKQYQVKFTFDNVGEGYLRATAHDDAIVTWDETARVLEITGNKEDINFTLKSLEYIPTLNFNTDFTIYYYQKQTTDNIVQADGTAYFDMTFDANLLKYELDTSNTNIFYAEDLLEQKNLLGYTNLKNLDGAEEITQKDVYYVTTVRLNPTNQIYFSYDYAESGAFETGALLDVVETRASELTFTGSRDYCNKKIRELVISGYADQVGDVDLIYTQERWIDGKFDEVQADEVTALTFRGQQAGEAIFSPYKQYFTTEGAETITGEIATPRYLQEYEKVADANGNPIPKNQYTIPITIIDNASEPEGETLYKVELISSSVKDGMSINDTDFKTKEQFEDEIQNGIRLIVSESLIDILEHGETFKIYFRVIRKLPSGATATIEENFLTYEYVSKPRAFTWLTDWSENKQEVEFVDELSFTAEYAYEMTGGRTNIESAISIGVENRKDWSWGYKQNNSMIKGGLLYKDSHPVVDLFERDANRNPSRINNPGLIYNVSGELFKIAILNNNLAVEGNSNSFYRKFQVKPFGQPTVGTLRHEVKTLWGLKASLTVNYKEQVTKYSEHMSHKQYADDYIIPCFGHDTAGLEGSWSVPRFAYEQNTPSINDTATAVLCSHFWVSQQKYAFGFVDSNDDPNHIEYPWMGGVSGPTTKDLYKGIKGFPIDKRYICTPKWDKRMRTPRSSIMTIPPAHIRDAFGFAAKPTVKKHIAGYRYKNSTAQNILGDVINLKTQFHKQGLGKDDVPLYIEFDPIGEFQYKDYINPTIATRWYWTANYSTTLGYTMYAEFGVGRLTDFEARISIQSYRNGKYKPQSEKVITYDSTNYDEARERGYWFDDITSLIGVNNINRSNVRFDLQVSNEIFTDFRGGYNPRLALVRSYFYNGKTINECYANNKMYKSVKEGELEKNMWARRNTKDNTSRILPITITLENVDPLSSLGNERTAFVLPTGEYIHPEHGLTDFATHPLLNLNKDLRGKSIDKFIKISETKLAYVSVEEGKIDDGNNLIDIRFNNKLSANKNYNYIYVTKDPDNDKFLYAMMAYLDTGNTYTSDATTLRSRLVYINLEV